MALVKDVFGKTIKKVKEKINGVDFVPRVPMRCCMLGARGVGKTSVITSLYDSQRKAVSDTALFLSPDAKTQQILQGKKTMLVHMFDGLHDKGDLVTESGIPGDATETVFRFSYGMRSERVNIDLEIRDYPGEYLLKESDRVAEFVQEADAIMIVIDTPCLMEAAGKYHRFKNQPELIKDFLMNCLKDGKEKLVMFIPLKCEKYFHEGRIDEVTAAIEKEYSELIEYLKGKSYIKDRKKKKSICCVIAPIQTLGGVAFDSFGTDESGKIEEIVTREGNVLPTSVRYHYCAANAKFSPKFCEQPLCYLLSFMAKQYASAKTAGEQEGLLGRLGKMLRLIPQIDAFLLEMERMGRRRIENTEGYKVLFGRGKI